MRYHSPKRQQSTRDLRSLRPILVARAAGHCEHCNAPFRITDTGDPVAQMHHRLRRSQGGQDCPTNLLLVRPECHTVHQLSIHQEPSWSVENGWIVERGKDPARTPAMIAGQMRWLRPDGTVEPVDGCRECGSSDCSPLGCEHYARSE